MFDHGLQYISQDKNFQNFFKLNKSVKQWDKNFIEIDRKVSVLPPSEKLVGITGNNDFVNQISFRSMSF